MTRRRTGSSAASAWRADRHRYGPAGWRQVSWWAVAHLRFGQWADERTAGLAHRGCVAVYWSWSPVVEALTGVCVTKDTKVGGGLLIHHAGPVVVHREAVLGRDCTVEHGVTVGLRRPGEGLPVIGDRVFLGAYAQVLGPVRIGDDAVVGALTLVLDDVLAGSTATGIPARSHLSGTR